MNRTPDVELVLRDWLADDGDIAPDRILEVVAGRIAEEPRRPWRLPWRLTVNGNVKLIAGLAAALVVAVAAWQLLPKSGGYGGQPTPNPSPGALPSRTPVATDASLPNGTLTGGRYVIALPGDLSNLSVIADVPAGWLGHPEVPALTRPDENTGILIGFMKADSLFGDPCQWDLDGTGSSDQAGDVVAGTSVSDLVAALKANTSYTSSAATPITIGAYQGQELELQLPGADVISKCDNRQGETSGDFFVFPGGFYALAANSRWDLFIVDVDGTRLIILVSIAPGTPEADVVAARAIVDSFEIPRP